MGVKRFTLKLAIALIGTLLLCDYFEVISLKPLKDLVERNPVILAAIFILLALALACRLMKTKGEVRRNGASGS